MAVAETFSLSETDSQEISALIKAGFYTSKSDLAKDALRCLFTHKPQLKINAAIQLYKEGIVSLGRAAEVAGINTVDFRKILIERKTLKTLKTRKRDLSKGLALVKRIRK